MSALEHLLKHKLIHHEQECEGDYWFKGANIFYTPGFGSEFGDELSELILVSLELIEELEHPDYLQSFTYNNIKYWVISDYDKTCSAEWIKEQNGVGPVVTFLLPSEY